MPGAHGRNSLVFLRLWLIYLTAGSCLGSRSSPYVTWRGSLCCLRCSRSHYNDLHMLVSHRHRAARALPSYVLILRLTCVIAFQTRSNLRSFCERVIAYLASYRFAESNLDFNWRLGVWYGGMAHLTESESKLHFCIACGRSCAD